MFRQLHPFFIMMVIGLLGLLAFVVVSDLFQSMMNNRPMSYSVLNLIKLAMAGVLGACAGYLAKSKENNDEKD